MNAEVLGAQLATWRREARLTQTQVAARMGTKQSVISRVEAGRSLPTLPFLERFAKACGRTQVVLSFEPTCEPRPGERRRRVRRVLGEYVFNPWDRDPTPAEARTLLTDGLTRERFERRAAGRHWERTGLAAVVEFPDDKIDGDETRTKEVRVGPGRCRVIGLDDLYLDRLRQATIDEKRQGVEFNSALAVVAARYEEIDWSYVRLRIKEISAMEGRLADTMKRIDSRIRRRVRRALAEPDRD